MRTFVLGLALGVVTTAIAADTNTDKSQYSLFHPTPVDQLRAMNSEQADKILNPFTVDAGHVQIEASLVDYYNGSRQGSVGRVYNYNNSANAFYWAPSFKVGLLNNLDLEVEPSYHTISASQSGYVGSRPYSVSRTESEFGNVNVAVKANLWGNDGGATALALRPYISIPTQGGRTVVGGLDVPFAWQLPFGLTLKIASGIGAVENGDGTLYVGFENSAALEKNLTPELLVFVNLATGVTTDEAADWVGYAGFGAAYTLSRNFQAYAGMRFGFEDGYDYNPYAGITLRF
jgi:hypothetical protein